MLGAEQGEVSFRGRPLQASPRRGADGIAMVLRALSLVGALSLVEHVALGGGAGRFDAAAARAAQREDAARHGATLPLEVFEGNSRQRG